MQHKYTIRDIEFDTGEEKVVHFDFGVKGVGKPNPIKKPKLIKSIKPKPTVIIESTSTPSSPNELVGVD